MISRERIREEFFKIAEAQNAKQVFQLMIENDVLEKCGWKLCLKQLMEVLRKINN